jgi:hypothetical protein
VADYTIAAAKVATPLLTLAAGVEDTVTFTGRFEGRPTVVVHSATAAVWVTADGNSPDPANGFARPLLSGVSGQITPSAAVPTVIRLYSTSSATYSVEA